MSGPLGSSQWMYATGADFYSKTIDQSLRFENGKLTKNISSAGNGKTFTVSMWVKRTETGVNHELIAAGHGSDGVFAWRFRSDDTMQFVSRYVNTNGANFQIARRSSRVFRDVGAWYHCVLAVDTTVSGASSKLDYFKIYVNGEDITSDFTTTTNNEESVAATYNDDTRWNLANNKSQSVGYNQAFTTNYFVGYLAEIHSISGTKLTADSFGETKNGVWVPKEYTGSYGTEGFYFNFADSSDIGNDASSGGSTDYGPSGLDSSDVVLDSPTNNFATINALTQETDQFTLAEGNLKATTNVGAYNVVRGTFGVSSGKWYWEVLVIAVNDVGGGQGRLQVGVQQQDGNQNSYVGADAYGWAYNFDGLKINNGTASYGAAFATNDVIGVALDMDAGTITFYKNNTSQGTSHTNVSGEVFPALSAWQTGGYQAGGIFNFGQDSTFADSTRTAGGNSDGDGNGDFLYSVPSGYKALCAASLSELTIGPNSDTQSDDNFNTVLYTGDGTTSRSITGVGFTPDWIWGKSRSNAEDHFLHNTVRGAGKKLESNNTGAEDTTATAVISAFESDGFTGPSSTPGNINVNSRTYVTWNWKAGGSSNTFNVDGTGYSDMSSAGLTDGNLALTGLSVNTTAKFSLATFTMPDAQKTVAHGLGVKPEMIIFKLRSIGSWMVWHKSFGENTNDVVLLNTTAAKTDSGGSAGNWFRSISSTLTEIKSAGSYAGTGNYIMYSFASVPGYSKVGTYTGATKLPFIFTGFKPAWLMVRRTNSAGGWHIFDNKRPNAFNEIDKRLEADNTDDENSTSGCEIDFLSNGFKFRGTFDNINGNGDTHIYLAFAEAPFKYANAR